MGWWIVGALMLGGPIAVGAIWLLYDAIRRGGWDKVKDWVLAVGIAAALVAYLGVAAAFLGGDLP